MKIQHQKPGTKIAAGIQAFMSLMYMGCGVFLFSSEKGKLIVPADFLPYSASALTAYGIFRAFRAWHQIKNSGIRSL
jgi:hypothetical protein